MNETDARVLKTRDNIKRCFLELLKKKPLDKISVKELCEMARCSRNTFYAHFPYIEALYDSVINEFIEQVSIGFLVDKRMENESDEEYSLRKIRTMASHVLSARNDITAALNDSHMDTFFSRLQDVLYKMMLDSSTEVWTPAEIDIQRYRMVCWYSSGAIVGFLRGFIYDKAMSTEEALDILCDLHINAFKVSLEMLGPMNDLKHEQTGSKPKKTKR